MARGGRSTAALLAACGAGALWGKGALVVNLLIVRHRFSPETISFWRFIVGAVVLLAAFGRSSICRPLDWPAEVPPEAWLLYLGVVTAALAPLAFSWGAARLTPTALTVATLVALSALLLMCSIGGLSAREARQHGVPA